MSSRKDEQMFAQEAHFASHRMQNQLAASAESADLEAPASAAYLQRKTNQGRKD